MIVDKINGGCFVDTIVDILTFPQRKAGEQLLYGKINEHPNLDEYEEWLSSYGVADTPEQALERYSALVDDPDRKFLFRYQIVRKHDQEEEGGWRWHKWGEYIGKKEPKCEYLYNEPEIEEVWVFHFEEVV